MEEMCGRCRDVVRWKQFVKIFESLMDYSGINGPIWWKWFGRSKAAGRFY